MTREEKLTLAKAAIRDLPDYGTGLRWNRDSWDYALFEKRFKVGIALEERPLDPGIHGFVVVQDEDTVESLQRRVGYALSEAGWGRTWREKPPSYRRDRDRFSTDEE